MPQTEPGAAPAFRGLAEGEKAAKGVEKICEEAWKSPEDSLSRRREQQPCEITGVPIGFGHVSVIRNLGKRT